jgi:hypothetical protein
MGMRRGIYWVLVGKPERERDDLEDTSVDGRKILRWIFRKWDGVTDWVDLAQVRNRWLALANAVMNLRVP